MTNKPGSHTEADRESNFLWFAARRSCSTLDLAIALWRPGTATLQSAAADLDQTKLSSAFRPGYFVFQLTAEEN